MARRFRSSPNHLLPFSARPLPGGPASTRCPQGPTLPTSLTTGAQPLSGGHRLLESLL